MNNLSRHPLLKQCYDVMQAIEMCGASPALTAAVIKAGGLLESIDKHIPDQNQANNLPTKVTGEALKARIKNVEYLRLPDGRTTLCTITMVNGFTVRGESSCVSIDEFDQEKGEVYAYEDAFTKAWPFEGYLLHERRFNAAFVDALPIPTSDAPPPSKKRASLTFGEAIETMKQGFRVARAGWNGKGMFLQLTMANDYRVRGANDVALLAPDVDLAPWIGMKTADNKFVPWLASQTDMLAEDWTVLL